MGRIRPDRLGKTARILDGTGRKEEIPGLSGRCGGHQRTEKIRHDQRTHSKGHAIEGGGRTGCVVRPRGLSNLHKPTTICR